MLCKAWFTKEHQTVGRRLTWSLLHSLNWIVEVAQNFKEQGNDYYKGKRYREAVGFYTQGLEANPTDTLLHEALLCNRAACNLELREINPHTVPPTLH